ncbi:MAG: hypothetical protein HXO29_10175 [Prevotella sp.]|nr:hypothetical protein [Prevotella sp.]
MKKFNQLKSVLTNEFSVLNKESLMLVLGGQAHTVSAQGSCGSSRVAKAVTIQLCAITCVLLLGHDQNRAYRAPTFNGIVACKVL